MGSFARFVGGLGGFWVVCDWFVGGLGGLWVVWMICVWFGLFWDVSSFTDRVTMGEYASVLCHVQSATHRKVAVLHIAIWLTLSSK